MMNDARLPAQAPEPRLQPTTDPSQRARISIKRLKYFGLLSKIRLDAPPASLPYHSISPGAAIEPLQVSRN